MRKGGHLERKRPGQPLPTLLLAGATGATHCSNMLTHAKAQAKAEGATTCRCCHRLYKLVLMRLHRLACMG